MPRDDDVVLTDVRGSTRAIEAGRYRDVNAVGVASIVAVRNAIPDLEIPYVFGGDGATLLVPDSRRAAAESALRGVRKIAQQGFALELRAGIVPVAALQAAGHAVQAARFRVSPNVHLAMLRGRGIAEAERWVKDPERGQLYAVSGSGPDTASFAGFECRWRPVPSRRGQIVCVIVQALETHDGLRARTYRQVIDALDSALGHDGGHPVWLGGLRLGSVFGDYGIEARVRSGERAGPAFRAARAFALRKTQIGRALATMEREFALARAEGRLVYGIHRAPSALITCYVRSFTGDHVHFVDGSGGGYALAARALKAQLAERPGLRPTPVAQTPAGGRD